MTILSVPDAPKQIRETLAIAQSLIGQSPYNEHRKKSDIAILQRLIGECDRHRPLGVGGNHGNLHTETCGCDPRTLEAWRKEGTKAKCGEVHAATVTETNCPGCIAVIWPKASV